MVESSLFRSNGAWAASFKGRREKPDRDSVVWGPVVHLAG
jgi:hypothetical protein